MFKDIKLFKEYHIIERFILKRFKEFSSDLCDLGH